MTKVLINPGVCGFNTTVTAESEDGMEVKLKVSSGCKSIMEMMQALGESYEAFDICLKKPGEGAFYEYAQEHFPVHVACPVINGIIKCAEAECRLALPRNCSIEFVEE